MYCSIALRVFGSESGLLVHVIVEHVQQGHRVLAVLHDYQIFSQVDSLKLVQMQAAIG